MTTTTLPHNLEMEESIIGSIIVTNKVLDGVVTGPRLRPEHFYRARNAHLFTCALALAGRGDEIDSLALSEESRRQGNHVEAHVIEDMVGRGELSSAPAHARRLVQLAYLRRVVQASYELQAGVVHEDQDRILEAERLLAKTDTGIESRSEPWDLADRALAYIEDDGKDAIELPFRKFNECLHGGLRPGTLTYIGGHSSMGKSVLLDQIASHAVKASGVKAHLYINEMDRTQRALRLLAGISGVDFGKLMRGKSALSEFEVGKLLDAGPNIPFGITDITGWPVEDICREIRWRKHDLVGVDIIHQIPHRDVADLDNISRTLAQTARSSDAAIVAAVHLNERRVMTAVRPPPTLGDIRGSGMFQRDADNVIFVHREQDDEDGAPLPEGATWLSKARNGALGGLRVILNERRMEFSPEAHA